jgi:hypothetical protein
MYSNEVGLTAVCVGCESGKYRQSKTISTICVDCPAGWSSLEGSTKCQACEAGKYGNVVGEDCKNCDVGHYRTTANDVKACLTCPSGYSQNIKGQTSW